LSDDSTDGVRIGVDLGGTKIEVIALDPAGLEVFRHRTATPRGDYAGTIEAIVELVDRAERAVGARASVGIGIPGAVSSRTNRVKNANSTWIIGRALTEDLRAALGRPLRVENDANCLAVSEATDGAGVDGRVVFAVIVGTGTGAGIAIDGRAHRGRNAVGGEWGHNPLPWARDDELPGPVCYCGRRGCVETWLSGPGFERSHRALGGDGSAAEVFRRADAGDAVAERAVAVYEDRMARSLAHVINVLDPDVIVLGGGMSKQARLYRNVPPLLEAYVFGGEADTPVRPAAHGDSSGVRGAAWLWPLKR